MYFTCRLTFTSGQSRHFTACEKITNDYGTLVITYYESGFKKRFKTSMSDIAAFEIV